MIALTVAQRELLVYLVHTLLAKGWQPSVRDMARHFGISSTAVWCRLDGLRRKGCIGDARQNHCAIPITHMGFEEAGSPPAALLAHVPPPKQVLRDVVFKDGAKFSITDW